MADPILKPGTVPGDAPLPDSVQKMVNLVAAYVAIDGLGGLQGVVISSSEPVSTDRDKAWIKLDAGTGRAVGLFRYLGGWVQIPVVVSSGTSEPASPVVGELFYNTDTAALKINTSAGWTNELWHKGTTAKRPTGVPVGYNYFDTDISRLLRSTSGGWSTVDGAIGQLAMFSGMTSGEAETRNPGWVIFSEMNSKFPLGFEEGEHAIGEAGGRESFPVTASGGKNNAQSGSEIALNGLNVDGIQIGGNGSVVAFSGSNATLTKSVDIIPPFLAVIFMRKQF